MKVFLGAFGDAGHAFPMLALGTELVARGHEVHFETWKRWRPHAEAAGIRFADAPEYQVFPTESTKHLKPYAAAVRAAPVAIPAMNSEKRVFMRGFYLGTL